MSEPCKNCHNNNRIVGLITLVIGIIFACVVAFPFMINALILLLGLYLINRGLMVLRKPTISFYIRKALEQLLEFFS